MGGFFCCHVHTTTSTLSRCCFRNQQIMRTQYVATALPLFVDQNDMGFQDIYGGNKTQVQTNRITGILFWLVRRYLWFFKLLYILYISSTHMWILLHQIHTHLQTPVPMPFDLFRNLVPVRLMILPFSVIHRQFAWTNRMVTVLGNFLQRLAVWFASWIWLPDELKASTGEWVWISAEEMSGYCW